jgi:hypothetical protein
MIECADRAAKGDGDGRISIEDAMALLRFVKDENVYSEVEKTRCITSATIINSLKLRSIYSKLKSGSGRQHNSVADPAMEIMSRVSRSQENW